LQPEGMDNTPVSKSSGKTVSLKANIFWLYGLLGLNYLIPAALLPYLVHVLGIERYGLITFAQSISWYFLIAVDFGFNFTAQREIAIHAESREEVSRVFWTTMIIKSVFLVVGFCLLLGLIWFVPRFRADAPVFLAAYVAVVGNALFPVFLFQGLQKMQSITIITGIARIIAAALTFLLVRHRGDVVIATLLQSGGFLLSGIIGFAVVLRSHVGSVAWPTRKDLIRTVVDGRHVFVSNASITLFTNTNTFLVGLLAGTSQAAYFSLGDKFIRGIVGLLSPVVQAAYPHIIRLLSKSRDLGLLFFRRTVIRGVAAGLVIGLGLFVAAPWLARLGFGAHAGDVTPQLRVLSLFPAITVITYCMGTLGFIPLGLEKSYSRLLLGVGIANVALAFILIPHLGALGGAIGMVVMEFLQTIAGLYLLHRNGIRFTTSALTQGSNPSD
jgi:PST family polysaccharide transporter